jgi:hypothetical protein
MARSIVLRALPLVGLVVGGTIIAVLAGSSVVVGVGFFVAAVGAVLLTALFFYEVGASEDRDRAAGR